MRQHVTATSGNAVFVPKEKPVLYQTKIDGFKRCFISESHEIKKFFETINVFIVIFKFLHLCFDDGFEIVRESLGIQRNIPSLCLIEVLADFIRPYAFF